MELEIDLIRVQKEATDIIPTVHLVSPPQDPDFQPDLVASKSYAAAGLCSWVLNIVKFYEVYCEVEPKRQALSKANAELAAAQEKLTTIKTKINVRHLILTPL